MDIFVLYLLAVLETQQALFSDVVRQNILQIRFYNDSNINGGVTERLILLFETSKGRFRKQKLMDFIGECMDEIANQMAKMRYMFGGAATLPVTVLTMAGAGQNLAAQHSPSLEAWLAHLPGIKVVCPSNPYDAKGMTIAAARDDNPVFVVFNKASLALMGEVPEGSYEVPIGKAAVLREGKDLTIIGISRMVHEALAAADQLKELGLDVEVIDARSIQPFDTETVVNSIKKTHRALVVHEAVRFGGFGGEITAQIQEEAFDYLDAPVMRVGAPFSPVPFSPALEQIYMPNADSIVAEVKKKLEL